ncbi:MULTISPECIES: DUF4435 domain-containing protein [Enterobacteriaceae]|uniref:DUF4435 domain-containing protein n=2 Tax=Enterobacteriaceae TaxID=543 RepID=A0A7T0GXV8_9ENTR|nr:MULTISPECIES: DUF4435 domain-containing protein [Enterobacteriaceae]ELA5891116.1 DUF4435 domain-containing protein [Escherichia coli]EKG3234638.1 DUF4435 domain-containing protein [Enterobacter hormaechei]ELJ6210475.1 DUF4435 domain-containing protein [Citrobacter freundii]ELR6029715.1 DUF4435 domain-containing protein [Citrobacter freundii]MBJ9153481.1 DUF4435 domain-containing protein [Citrobacter freundii]
MTFARTASGLRNYNKFYKVEAIVYIEGRMLEKTGEAQPSDDTKVFDVIFYTSLFKIFSPHNNIKLKIVGCKENVLDYHDKIINEKIENSFAIIDRDYDGIYYTRTNHEKLIVTHGYSWENDFWSTKLYLELVSLLSLDAENACNIVRSKINRSLRRLCLINRANLVTQYFGTDIFPVSKKGGDKGFRYDVNLKYPLPLSEIKRLFNKIPDEVKNDSELHDLVVATELDFKYLIQGHFYEYMILQILSYAYKVTSGIKHNMVDFNIIKNLAFNSFKLKPDYYLEPATLSHYEQQFSRVLHSDN